MTNGDQDIDERLLRLLAAGLPTSPPSAGLRRALEEKLRGDQRYAPFEAEVAEAFNVSPSALRAAFARTRDENAFRPGPWPESRVLSTRELAPRGVVLAQLAPGTRIAAHGHDARELTYVLSGELTEDSGRTLRAGELLTAEVGYEHALHVEGPHPCLVVFAARPPG